MAKTTCVLINYLCTSHSQSNSKKLVVKNYKYVNAVSTIWRVFSRAKGLEFISQAIQTGHSVDNILLQHFFTKTQTQVNCYNNYICNCFIITFVIVNCYIVITFYSPSWAGDSEGTFPSSSQAATCPPVYHTRWRLHLLLLNVMQGSCEYHFFVFLVWSDRESNPSLPFQ